MPLSSGTTAPIFSASTDGGAEFDLSTLSGKWIVLYFYPKDDTEACTQEACDFRDNMQALTALDTVVIGVSPDSVKSHDKFKVKHGLNFVLISDNEQREICQAYGVWVEKSMYGKKYMGVERTTYVIDPNLTIRMVYPKVKVKGHVAEILDWLGKNVA